MKQTVFDYIVYSTSQTTWPTSNMERQNTSCEGNFLRFALSSVIKRLNYQTLSGKEPVHFSGRNVGWTQESGRNQAYYEHSVR